MEFVYFERVASIEAVYVISRGSDKCSSKHNSCLDCQLAVMALYDICRITFFICWPLCSTKLYVMREMEAG